MEEVDIRPGAIPQEGDCIKLTKRIKIIYVCHCVIAIIDYKGARTLYKLCCNTPINVTHLSICYPHPLPPGLCRGKFDTKTYPIRGEFDRSSYACTEVWTLTSKSPRKSVNPHLLGGEKVGIWLTIGMPNRWCIWILYNSNPTSSLRPPGRGILGG